MVEEESIPTLLIIDDEANMRHMLSALLERQGYGVESAPDAETALKRLEKGRRYQFILCDLKMPGMDGMAFLEAARPFIEHTTVVVMSAYGTIDTALEAMKHGAYDYISKPFKPDEVTLTLAKAVERERLKKENSRLRCRIETFERQHRFSRMIAKSRQMQDILHQAEKIAGYDVTVLITGESGTGKELVAKGIHLYSDRAAGPMVAVNCGGIPESLLESELFGHRKGAFTGAIRNKVGLMEAAHTGTFFLDEVGELPLSLQVKLLRALQEKEVRSLGDTRTRQVDVRIIAATVKDLENEVKNGRFREDLYYRLCVFPLHLPPLRKRIDDIPLLTEHFIGKHAGEMEKAVNHIDSDAMDMLMIYPWPGNVRELENAIERAVLLADGTSLKKKHFSEKIRNQALRMETARHPYSIKKAKRTLEKEMIEKALSATNGNRTQSARLLEISHPSLLSKIKQYGIDQ